METQIMEKTFDAKTGKLGTSILKSAGAGLIGFIMFLLLIFMLKSMQMIFGITSVFKMDIYDILISFTGFIMMFLISFLKHISNVDKMTKD
jgi:hypothetical protein